MPNQEAIEAVQLRLAAARQRLRVQLTQQIIHGPAHVPPSIVTDIADARKEIQYCKSVLRDYDVEVEDEPDDDLPGEVNSLFWSNSKERADLLSNLQVMWIEGVLNQSLHGAALLELGLSYDPKAVSHPWEMVVQVPDQQSDVTGTPIIHVFDQFDGRLLILGAPGGGKTTMLLELARALIERARNDRRFPLPVILHLAHWLPNPPGQNDKKSWTFGEWVQAEVAHRYDISAPVAKDWVQQESLILLLDGLDEVTSLHRLACVEAINDFRHTHPSVRMVVCSRIEEYEHLAARLQLKGALRIAPLTQQQIDRYLQQLGEKTNVVRDLLEREPELQELATTPLLLNIMIMAYQGLNNLPTQSANQGHNWRIQIFTDYIERMLYQKGKSNNFPADNIVKWLSWIATQLWLRRETIFEPNLINISWIPSKYSYFGEQDNIFLLNALYNIMDKIAIPGLDIGYYSMVRTVLLEVASLSIGSYFLGVPYAIKYVRKNYLKNRFIKEALPSNLIDFLDYCVKLIFLRKTGESYIFTHRYILERFVSWDFPQIVFEEERFLSALKDHLKETRKGVSSVGPGKYFEYRWRLIQYIEAGAPGGCTPEGFIEWLSTY